MLNERCDDLLQKLWSMSRVCNLSYDILYDVQFTIYHGVDYGSRLDLGLLPVVNVPELCFGFGDYQGCSLLVESTSTGEETLCWSQRTHVRMMERYAHTYFCVDLR